MKTLLFVCFLTSIITLGSAQDGQFNLDKVYPIKKNGTIDLSSTDAKVFITGSLRPDVHVKINRKVTVKGLYNSRDEFRVEVDPADGNLRIKEYQNSFNYFDEDYKIEIEAPEGVTLSIRGDDGDYFIKNINGSISMSMDDADAELSDCKGESFSFRVDDGDIRMDRGQGILDLDADDADVEIYNGKFKSISARVDDGDLIVQTSLTDDGQYSFNCQDGLVSLDITSGGGDFRIRHDDGSVNAHGSFKTTFEEENEIRMTLAKGSAHVNVKADDARVKLSAN